MMARCVSSSGGAYREKIKADFQIDSFGSGIEYGQLQMAA